MAKEDEDTKKNQEIVETATFRLEGRLDRFREEQNSQIALMKSNQEKFQEEMKKLVTGLKPTAQNQAQEIHLEDETGASTKNGEFGDDEAQVFYKGKHSGGGNWRYRKIEMSLFEGSDPDGWILRVEKYFTVCRLTEEEKVDVAVVAMEGDALKWYQWENGRTLVRSWPDLKARILHQFRPLNVGSLHEQWLATTQTSTVLEYRQRFIEMASSLKDVPDSLLMGQFINGLKEEIKVEVRLLNPLTLEQTMEGVPRVEERNRVNGVRRVGVPGMGPNRTEPVLFQFMGTGLQ